MTTQETDQRARRAFVLLNHTLTQAQRDDLAAQWGVTDIILPDAVLSQAWSRVDPRGDLDTQLLDAVETWLVAAARPDDLVVAQGEFGATYAVVGRALRLGLVPVYATSVRNAVETLMPDGAVRIQRVFAHVQFRRYPV